MDLDIDDLMETECRLRHLAAGLGFIMEKEPAGYGLHNPNSHDRPVRGITLDAMDRWLDDELLRPELHYPGMKRPK